jgi:hypothetical protein
VLSGKDTPRHQLHSESAVAEVLDAAKRGELETSSTGMQSSTVVTSTGLEQQQQPVQQFAVNEPRVAVNEASAAADAEQHHSERPAILDNVSPTVEARTEYIPMAIAKRYKLAPINDPSARWLAPASLVSPDDPSSATVEAAYTANELRSLVQVRFPPGGGFIQPRQSQRPNDDIRYEIFDREGMLRRVLFVNVRGEVYQDLSDDARQDDESPKDRNNIKLGLGDFIFYSILVAKAAMFSFTAFTTCSLVILVGLLSTLILLGVYGKALPALPISIALGVAFYFLTRYLIQPWIHAIFIEQSYV